MSKKEVYDLAWSTTQQTLRAYFGQGCFGDGYFKGQEGKALVKKVYDHLAKTLLGPETEPPRND